MCIVRILGIVLFSLVTGFCSAQEPVKVIKIGLIHFSPPLSKDMDFSPTLHHLQKALAPWKVEAKVYSSKNLEQAIKEGTIDFFFASSGFFYRMLPFGVRDIATVVTAEKPSPNQGTAGAFITHRDRTDIKRLADMKDKVFTANYDTAFHGYRTGMAELAYRGYEPDKFFKERKFVGESADRLIKAIINKEAEVGYIRACWLEEHELQNIAVLDKIKVIEPISGPIRCLHSTRSYPNNTFASTFKVDHDVAKRVSVALLTMKPSATGQHWSLATDFKPVDDLYKVLKVGPYSYLNEWSLNRFLLTYWPVLALIVLVVMGLIAHSWRAQKLVDKATIRLLAAEENRNKLREKARELTEKMEAQHKLSLVNQLSSIFAHEMNQPLAACKYLIDGLKTLTKPGGRGVSAEILNFSIKNFEKELNRATAIVNKVRQYARTQATRDKKVDMKACLDEVLQTVNIKYKGKVTTKVVSDDNLFVEGDPVELQILVWNLIKNAAEASLEVTQPVITIECSADGESVEVKIINSGKLLTEQEVAEIGKDYLKSKKAEGLGIGLQVAKSILEAMGSRLVMQPNKSGGITQIIKLTQWKDKE